MEQSKPIDMLDMSPKKNGIAATGDGFDMLNMDLKGSNHIA